MWSDELVGSGLWIEDSFREHDAHRQLELPTSRRLLQEITDRLGTSSNVGFQLRFTGSAEVVFAPGTTIQRMVGDPEPGQPMLVSFNEQNVVPFSIPRTEWFDSVVAKLGDSDYVPLELLVPRGAVGDVWRTALGHVAKAKRAYTLGDDPAVFGHLRAALDAAPGAKQHIFDVMAEPKRTEVDALVTALGRFLHAGRHVDADTGEFPVDHIDAGFALNLMDILLSYASRALEAAAAR